MGQVPAPGDQRCRQAHPLVIGAGPLLALLVALGVHASFCTLLALPGPAGGRR